MKSLDKLFQWLHQPVSSTPLAYYRIGFGAILFWEVLRYFKNGWIYTYWIQPKTYFGYEGFEWVTPWAGNWMFIHFFFLGILALFICLGLFYRYASIAFFFGFTFVFLLDKSNYLNHFYLVVLLSGVNIFLPLNNNYSLDAKLWPDKQSAYAPNWSLRMIQIMLGIAYFFGGVAKITPDWLQGLPIGMWILNSLDMPIIGGIMDESWAKYFFAYSGLMLDLLIVPALLWKRTRTLGFIAIISFHLLNSQLFSIGIFPWFMIAATFVFLPHDRFDKLLKRPLPKEKPTYKVHQVGMALMAAFLLWQVLMPFRHHLFPGNVHWNEAGHRFAWHMKLRTKRGSGAFFVVDRASGERQKVNLKDHLTKRQRTKMKTHPDMIVQFGHYLEEEYKKQGFNVGVFADLGCTLNGRPYQQFTNPEVDLTTISSSEAYSKLVVPLETPLPDFEPKAYLEAQRAAEMEKKKP